MTSTTFVQAPFAVFYSQNPKRDEILTLAKNNVRNLFLDYSNFPFRSLFDLFDPVIYFNAGAFEKFNPNHSGYPSDVIGSKMKEWDGEYWLNIRDPRTFKVLTDYINRSMSEIVKKYPNWYPKIDLDNLDLWQQKTGFAITQDEQIEYINNLIKFFHQRWSGSVCVRNSSEILNKINPDAYLVEEAVAQKFYSKFSQVDKPVFDIEYYKSNIVAALSKINCKSIQKKQKINFFGSNLNLNKIYYVL